MIISRYLIKEILNALFGMTFILLLVFLSNQLVRSLSLAAVGKLAPNVLLQLLGFEVPYLLSLLLPLGLFIGIIVAYGRLYSDNEMSVLQACGLSVKHLVTITAFIALIVAGLVLFLTMWVNPWIAGQKEQFIARLASESAIDTLMAGRFQVSENGRRVLYVEKISPHHKEANNLFVADEGKKSSQSNDVPWSVVSAAFGSQLKEPGSQDQFVIARDGYRYEGIPGQNDFKIIQFKKYTVRLSPMEMISKHKEQEAVSSFSLLKNYHDSEKAAELQWRLSIPLSVLILALLAVPLSYVRPRKSRYSSLFPAILIYVIYINLLFMTRNWVEQKFTLGLGMGWVHLLLLFAASLYTLFQAGVLNKYFLSTKKDFVAKL